MLQLYKDRQGGSSLGIKNTFLPFSIPPISSLFQFSYIDVSMSPVFWNRFDYFDCSLCRWLFGSGELGRTCFLFYFFVVVGFVFVFTLF